MKSLNDRYTESQSSVHETFADLIFCALVVLVLFVMMLAIEVSQRVRTKITEVPEVPEVPVVENVQQISPEELEELSRQLKQQEEELNVLRDKMVKQAAALSGEQRFTGAREPASLNIAYDYVRRRFYFVSAKDVDHADRSQSGESSLTFLVRKRLELRAIASRAARSQRGYTKEEAIELYSAFSKYQQINPTERDYTISQEKVGISYHTQLCGLLSGDDDVSEEDEARVVNAMLEIYENVGPDGKKMYPVLAVNVQSNSQTVSVNGVTLKPLELRNLLLSLDGRGAMIDLFGIETKPPEWLREQTLIPAGYIGNVPKLPQ